jgi:hypothetical protein
LEHLPGIPEQPEIGLVEIGLENAIRAFEAALHANVKDPVAAAEVMAGPRAMSQKTAPVGGHFQEVRIEGASIHNPVHNLEAGSGKCLPELARDEAISDSCFHSNDLDAGSFHQKKTSG